MKEVIKEEKPFSCKYCKKKNNGSLFTYLPATVTVNGLENEMSGYRNEKSRPNIALSLCKGTIHP